MFFIKRLYGTLVQFNKFVISNRSCVPRPLKVVAERCRLTQNISQTVPLQNRGFINQSIIGLSILSWLGFIGEDEEKESELIMTLKRAVLSAKREEFDKAEQLLHIALRLAQQQQNGRGITYCYDLMANVAFDRYELDKAQKLFVSVLQRLLRDGASEDDLRVIHISLKLARICHLKTEEDKADLGYNWCLTQISKKVNIDKDAKMLYGIIQDWYAQFLLDIGDMEKCLHHLKEAYLVCNEIEGYNSGQTMLLLNDLGTTSWRAGDIETARGYLLQAASIGKDLADKSHLGIIHANLGLISLEKGIIQEATKYCKEAWRLGNRHENIATIMQANYCLEQIKINISK